MEFHSKKKMKYAILNFPDLSLTVTDISKLRGFIGRVFSKHDIIHNHRKDGTTIYRYPLIQFKIVDGSCKMVAITARAVKVFNEIFMTMDSVDINGRVIPICEKDLILEDQPCGYSNEVYVYRLVSPWIALNKKNYSLYNRLNPEEKLALLKKSLTGNILSMSKGLGIWLNSEQRIDVALDVTPCQVRLKATSLIGFKGVFKTNYLIPELLGLGKSVSRGFGTVRKVL